MSVKIQGMDILLDRLRKMGGDGPMLVKAGVLEGANGYDNGASAALVAAVNEYGGTLTIPEHKQKLYFKQGKNGSVSTRFVKKSKSNFVQETIVGEHSVTIPPRPFMRHTFDTRKDEWVKELAGLLAAGESPKKALELVGTLMEDDIKAAINEPASDWKPANSPATLRRKHSTIPLIDNSILLKAIAYEVET